MMVMQESTAIALRQAISMMLVVLIAVLVNAMFFAHQEVWIILSAIIASVVSRGAPLTQALYFYLLMLIALMCSSWLSVAPETLKQGLTACVVLVGGSLAYSKQPLTHQDRLTIILVPVIFMIALLMLPPPRSVEYSFAGITIGTLIGLLGNQCLFYMSIETRFRAGVIPILRALNQYADALAEEFLAARPSPITPEERYLALLPAREAVENALQSQQSGYPEWVYDVGFKPGLREGMRYFLLNIERIAELLCSLDYLMAQPVDAETRHRLASSIREVTDQNSALLRAMIAWFERSPAAPSAANYTSDIESLQTALNEIVPNQLALLDLSPEYVILTALVRDYSDLRALLLQQTAALSAES